MSNQDIFPVPVPSRRHRFLVALVAGGLTLIGAAGAYLHLTFSRPVGRGPAGMTVQPEAFARPWTSKQVWLVGLGDSVTAGFGARREFSYYAV